MFEKIKFNEKHYPKIKSYLEQNYTPREISKKMLKMVGLIYEDEQKEKNASNMIFFHIRERINGYLPLECVIVLSDKHLDLNIIRKDLGELAIKN